MTQETPPTDARAPRKVGVGAWAAAAAIIVVVVGVYIAERSDGGWPPGHPWSGISLLSLAVMLVATRPNKIRVIVSALALISAFLWMISALCYR